MAINDETLPQKRYEEFINILIYNFDTEITRSLIITENLTKFSQYMLNKYYSYNCYLFFLPVNVEEVTKEWMKDVMLRDFIFNLTEKTSVDFLLNENVLSMLVNTVTDSICSSRPNKESQYSLIPSDIVNNLSIDKNIIKEILNNNVWILYVYLLLLYLPRSQLYTSLKENNK